PNKSKSDTVAVVNIQNIDEAIVYKDLVQHTLNQKCVQCHGEERQKGKLRLDNQEWIMAGGKNGVVINTSNLERSELIKRLFLDMNDELHMPPKEKEQLTDFEKTLLSWWVNSGGSFDKKVADLKPDEKTLKALNDFKEKYSSNKTETIIVRPEISKISDDEKRTLEKMGWVISPVSSKDNHIRVTGFNLEVPVKEALATLNKYNKHVIELKLSHAGIMSADMKSIAGFTELEKLWIDNNKLNDRSIAEISTLPKLSYINIVETGITEIGLREVLKITSLKVVHTNKSGLTIEQMSELRNNYKNIKFNFGVDSMMKLESDTLFMKKI
ncbi:MAG: c-type cytochrome domain-containing protein, partial [bacterium]